MGTLEEIVDFVIRHHRILLDIELEKGVPLNYINDEGQYVPEYPDGRIEPAKLPSLEELSCRE